MELGTILANEVLQLARFLIDVPDGLEDTVLTNVLRWELPASGERRTKRHSIVHVIDVLLRPATHITDETR